MRGYTMYRVCVYPKGFLDAHGSEMRIDPMYAFTEDYATLEEARRIAVALSADHDVTLTRRTVEMESIPLDGDEGHADA